MSKSILQTGLTDCFDAEGKVIPCKASGQDGEFTPGQAWPDPRFSSIDEHLVHDRATDLIWSVDANLFSFQMTWQEGLDAINEMNIEKQFGRSDWRLPNRREMRSLISHGARKPALPAQHPFRNVFLGWYWTSTTSAMARGYAWYVHMEGGRMFYGRKDSYYLVWPVCGKSTILPRTGQNSCYDDQGVEMNCRDSLQDGELLQGIIWPIPRFNQVDSGIIDNLTSLIWYPPASMGDTPSTWKEALTCVGELADKSEKPWRLPTINELESLVDGSRSSPALPDGHPFIAVQEAYWSSTTSFFEPDWAYVLYFHKGAVGVGYKKNKDFAMWPVMEVGKVLWPP